MRLHFFSYFLCKFIWQVSLKFVYSLNGHALVHTVLNYTYPESSVKSCKWQSIVILLNQVQVLTHFVEKNLSNSSFLKVKKKRLTFCWPWAQCILVTVVTWLNDAELLTSTSISNSLPSRRRMRQMTERAVRTCVILPRFSPISKINKILLSNLGHLCFKVSDNMQRVMINLKYLDEYICDLQINYRPFPDWRMY